MPDNASPQEFALAFALTVHHNQYLAPEDRTVRAILEITASSAFEAAEADPPVAAEVIIIDTSNSMNADDKLVMACRAAAAAVETLRDGTYFAIVAGHSEAEQVYPPAGGMVQAGADSRAAAARALDSVRAQGGTSMSTWLRLADRLLDGCPAQLKHALLLTDGFNVEGEKPLFAALRTCEGRFACDCRGIGDDWSWTQLKEIARVLNGSCEPVAIDRLADGFREVMVSSMARLVPEVTMRVRLAPSACLEHFKRLMPDIEDLTPKADFVNPITVDFPLGPWAEEDRHYQIHIDVGRADMRVKKEELARAAVVELVVSAPGGPMVLAKQSVLVTWTDDILLVAKTDPLVQKYMGYDDLAEGVADAVQAWDDGAHDAAGKLGRQVALAYRIGRMDVLEMLSRIVIIDDPALGTVKLRPRGSVARRDLHHLSFASEHTGRSAKLEPQGGADAEDAG
jgi:hypothetical protein